jgi:beta-glucanase (GH16 family)
MSPVNVDPGIGFLTPTCEITAVKRHGAFALILFTAAAGAHAVLFRADAQTASVPGWKLVWSDEFNQPNGSKPNPALWGYDIGGGGWGNGELETYTSRTNNARIENGMLVIEARNEDFTGSDGIARHYTSARLKTEGKYSAAYGRIEARMRLPRGQGVWPAFWLLGANIGAVGWPACGEVDIMENIGREPSIVHATIHGPKTTGSYGVGGPFNEPSGKPFADDFHVYAVEWAPDSMRFIVDSHAYFSATPSSVPSDGRWVFNAPEFIILNLAVGGGWPGAPDTSTVFPQQLLVDYVRVYTSVTSVAPAVKVQSNTNHVFLSWPGVFPQGIVEAAQKPSGPWMIHSSDGRRTSAEFFTEITPGFYRLALGD